ncbi:norsolorinic acid reductase, putative [Talaromyces stipitatus ATCC 10500]|uniref:Norsolorinic acid reductase, putative n=1 Tax=Talaromyces stipitatus (strain ATCC 10500 / CBS 375.48 / QM 6759 / NRRL 1006) TaxID=441959 RepID=B8MQB7_TALSN|nr:norsolorinic acid reductase, putative [Talaromyces stipitatus ATCC 10500]EED13319.1 norsolorinic acid reductase, putative [Talaromyces stipitatus ATCC 10500]
MAMIPPSPPKSALGRHRLLSPNASVRVSPLCLGGMSKPFGFGTNWGMGLGECTKEMAYELLDTFYYLDGNFVDTANTYQGSQSEEWIGDWMKDRGRHNEMIIATKYAMTPMAGKSVNQSNYGGTGNKCMHISIEASLKAMNTDYIDIYYVHAWDYASSILELMQSLNALVIHGKVLYLGISDAPAWFVTKANAYARHHGLRTFSVYQGRYSAQQRDMEREIIPMAREEGMAILAFGVLVNGYFKTLGSEGAGARRIPPTILIGREQQVSQVLDNVAKRHNVPLTSVTLAYAMQKTPYFYPIIGGRKVEHLKANIEALKLRLTPEDVAEIETGYNFDIGFTHNFINTAHHMIEGPQHVTILHDLGYFDYVAPPCCD